MKVKVLYSNVMLFTATDDGAQDLRPSERQFHCADVAQSAVSAGAHHTRGAPPSDGRGVSIHILSAGAFSVLFCLFVPCVQ